MGNQPTMSLDHEHFFSNALSVAEEVGLMPDIGIDYSLLKYSGLNSSSELENSVIQSLSDVGRNSPHYVWSLGSALTVYNAVPAAVGLGALALSMMLEFVIAAVDPQGRADRTMDMMRRVFAEEKASGVRDTMEEYTKRLGMYFQQPTQALAETERLEKQLSDQLTRLKNSMLHDNQMSSRSMKHWSNGAAFHLQMLIHGARLKMTNTSKHEAQLQIHVASIVSVLDRYQLFNLQELLKEYKTYKKSNIRIYRRPLRTRLARPGRIRDYIIKDQELGKQTNFFYYGMGSSSTDDYLDYIFNNWSMVRNLNSYFSDLKANIKELIIQDAEFNITTVLPALQQRQSDA